MGYATGVIVRDSIPVQARHVAFYARVSSVDQKQDVERQMERLKDDAAAHGYHVTRMTSENRLWTRATSIAGS